jgi:hypothetical protein
MCPILIGGNSTGGAGAGVGVGAGAGAGAGLAHPLTTRLAISATSSKGTSIFFIFLPPFYIAFISLFSNLCTLKYGYYSYFYYHIR